jgi:transcriptional regulator with XRE-family HTH domain
MRWDCTIAEHLTATRSASIRVIGILFRPVKSIPQDLLRQEKDAEELVRSVSSEVLGARLARARQRQGLSIRELATAAGVNKNSVVRVEKGGVPQPLTVLKLCAAMNIHLASLAEPEKGENEVVAVHRREDDRWHDITKFGAGPVEDRPLSAEERAELARQGIQSPMLILKNRLELGQILPNVIELYGPSPTRSHPGEEMVYVLKGAATITVGNRQFDLAEGEAATFYCSEEHTYAPAKGAELPVRLLSVTVHGRGPVGRS